MGIQLGRHGLLHAGHPAKQPVGGPPEAIAVRLRQYVEST
jgi:hypothetical protein